MNLARRELSETRGGIIGWSLAVVAVIALYVPFYPSLGGSDMMDVYLRLFPAELARLFGLDLLATGAGYVHATFHGLMGYLLLAIAAIGWGSRSIAGAEESGSLELTLAHAITRAQVVLEASVALLIRLALVSAASFLAILALNGPVGLGLDPVNLLAVTIALFLLAALIGFAALCGGALTGQPAVATGFGAFVAVAAYIMHALDQLAGISWLAAASPLRWAFGNDPLSTGFDLQGTLLLLAGMLVLLALSLWRFSQRDVGA